MTEEAYENVLAAIAVTESTPPDRVTECGTCRFKWDNMIVTAFTPVPAGRCPNEYNHPEPCEAEHYSAT